MCIKRMDQICLFKQTKNQSNQTREKIRGEMEGRMYLYNKNCPRIQAMHQRWSGGGAVWFHSVYPVPVDTQLPVWRVMAWCRLVPSTVGPMD